MLKNIISAIAKEASIMQYSLSHQNTPKLLKTFFSLFFLYLLFSYSASASVDSLYKTNCASCHGNKMQGGLGESLVDNKWLHGESDEQIFNVIKNGVANTDMMAWGNSLSAQEIRSLVIYIRETKYQSELEQMNKAVVHKNGQFSAAGEQFRLEKLDENSAGYWGIEFLPDNSYLVTEVSGKLWYFNQGIKTEIADIPTVWHRGQGGLLDIALHPDYINNKLIYLSYAQSDDGNKAMTAITRGRIEEGRWVTDKQIFKADTKHHLSSGAHFGDRMVFQNNDLYFSIGDRGNKEMAQDLSRPNGKIHRLTLDGDIPSDNPFVDTPKALASIWTYGNRNPQGMTLNTKSNKIWSVEHGPRGGDELNLITKANNYGWPLATFGMNYNGTPMTDKTSMVGMVQPIWHWTPSIAVSSIEFYHANAFSTWQNKALIGSLAKEELRLLTIVDDKVTKDELIIKGQGRIRDLKVAADGSIYLLLNSGSRSSRQGAIYRLVPAGK